MQPISIITPHVDPNFLVNFLQITHRRMNWRGHSGDEARSTSKSLRLHIHVFNPTALEDTSLPHMRSTMPAGSLQPGWSASGTITDLKQRTNRIFVVKCKWDLTELILNGQLVGIVYLTSGILYAHFSLHGVSMSKHGGAPHDLPNSLIKI